MAQCSLNGNSDICRNIYILCYTVLYVIDISLKFSGKNPGFLGLEDSGVLLEDGHLVDALGAPLPLTSPSRSSPRSQGSENGERFSRKVFVGGLPPDIDEG